jgi:SAM-dependent methyltransferase
MSFQQISKLPFLRECLCQLAEWRVVEKLNQLRPYLNSTDSVLDVGSGNGVLCDGLRKRGYSATALDIRNLSFIDNIKPVIYDGVKMPFRDLCFDVSLLITVLHHTPNPKRVLREAKRVAKQIIVIEEIYSNTFNKYLTYFIDSVFNFEFLGHPHTNMTDAGWRDLFERLGLKLVHAKYSRSILVLRRVTYILENDGLEVREEKGKKDTWLFA